MYFGDPLFHITKVVINEANGIEQCVLFADDVTPADIYLRFIHEEFFVNVPWPAESCYGLVTQTLNASEVIESYASSYITGRADF